MYKIFTSNTVQWQFSLSFYIAAISPTVEKSLFRSVNYLSVPIFLSIESELSCISRFASEIRYSFAHSLGARHLETDCLRCSVTQLWRVLALTVMCDMGHIAVGQWRIRRADRPKPAILSMLSPRQFGIRTISSFELVVPKCGLPCPSSFYSLTARSALAKEQNETSIGDRIDEDRAIGGNSLFPVKIQWPLQPHRLEAIVDFTHPSVWVATRPVTDRFHFIGQPVLASYRFPVQVLLGIKP